MRRGRDAILRQSKPAASRSRLPKASSRQTKVIEASSSSRPGEQRTTAVRTYDIRQCATATCLRTSPVLAPTRWTRNAATQSSHAAAQARQSAARPGCRFPILDANLAQLGTVAAVDHAHEHSGIERCDSQNSLHSRALAAHAAIQARICSWFMVSAPGREGRPCDRMNDFEGSCRSDFIAALMPSELRAAIPSR